MIEISSDAYHELVIYAVNNWRGLILLSENYEIITSIDLNSDARVSKDIIGNKVYYTIALSGGDSDLLGKLPFNVRYLQVLNPETHNIVFVYDLGNTYKLEDKRDTLTINFVLSIPQQGEVIGID
jgi:hypothetical protein